MEYQLLSKKTNQLTNLQIKSICKLKNTHWNYSYRSNLEWFKKNIKTYDIHNLIYYNSKLIGYTLLRIRNFYIEDKKNKYFYFDTLIIDKKYRNKGISFFLMHLNNSVINMKNKFSFLICSNKMVKYYEKFGWKKMNPKLFIIKDHNFKTVGMYFTKDILPKQKHIFYFYE